MSKEIKKISKLKTDALVELERYKVLAQFLEEENERLRNVKPEVIREVIHNESKRHDPGVVEREKIVEVPVERIVEVPVEKIVEVEKIVNVPYEVIKEVQVPYEVIKEVPVEVEVIKEIRVPVERIVEVERVVEVPYEVIKEIEVFRDVPYDRVVERNVEVPVYIDTYKEEREVRQRELHDLKCEIEEWRSKYQRILSQSDGFMRETNQLSNELQMQYQENNALSRKVDQLYSEIQSVSMSNSRKNADMESHISYLESMLNRHNVYYQNH